MERIQSQLLFCFVISNEVFLITVILFCQILFKIIICFLVGLFYFTDVHTIQYSRIVVIRVFDSSNIFSNATVIIITSNLHKAVYHKDSQLILLILILKKGKVYCIIRHKLETVLLMASNLFQQCSRLFSEHCCMSLIMFSQDKCLCNTTLYIAFYLPKCNHLYIRRFSLYYSLISFRGIQISYFLQWTMVVIVAIIKNLNMVGDGHFCSHLLLLFYILFFF